MWPRRQQTKREIAATLRSYSETVRELLGIVDARAVDTLAMQFVSSIRREDYFRIIQRRRIAPFRVNPRHEYFDPERAVAYHTQQGNTNEAAWLVFLMTHFGKPYKHRMAAASRCVWDSWRWPLDMGHSFCRSRALRTMAGGKLATNSRQVRKS